MDFHGHGKILVAGTAAATVAVALISFRHARMPLRFRDLVRHSHRASAIYVQWTYICGSIGLIAAANAM